MDGTVHTATITGGRCRRADATVEAAMLSTSHARGDDGDDNSEMGACLPYRLRLRVAIVP